MQEFSTDKKEISINLKCIMVVVMFLFTSKCLPSDFLLRTI